MSLSFVVGTGRCGSTMLSRLLALHPDVLSLSEYWNLLRSGTNLPNEELTGEEFWQRLAGDHPEGDALVRAGIKPDEDLYPYDRGRFSADTGVPAICRPLATITGDPDSLYDKLAGIVPSWPRRSPIDHSRSLFAELAAILARPVVVERTGASLLFLPELRAGFREARYVFLYRDGPDSALSMLRHPHYRLETFQLMAAFAQNSQVAEIPFSDEAGTMRQEDIKGLAVPPFDKDKFLRFPLSRNYFGWVWSSLIRAGISEIGKVPHDRWTIMRYERLLKDPRTELARLAGFLQIPVQEEWLERAGASIDPGRAGAAKSRLHPSDLATLRSVCGPGTRAFELLEAEHAAAVSTLP